MMMVLLLAMIWKLPRYTGIVIGIVVGYVMV